MIHTKIFIKNIYESWEGSSYFVRESPGDVTFLLSQPHLTPLLSLWEAEAETEKGNSLNSVSSLLGFVSHTEEIETEGFLFCLLMLDFLVCPGDLWFPRGLLAARGGVKRSCWGPSCLLMEHVGVKPSPAWAQQLVGQSVCSWAQEPQLAASQ